MFPAADAAGRQAAIDDNRRAIDEAAALGAECLVLVVGGLPNGLTRPRRRPRAMVADGLAAILAYARARRMPLAIEPLHPMYAADRACVNTLARRSIFATRSARRRRRRHRRLSRLVGPRTRRADRARRRGKRIFAYHICDWLVPTRDILHRPRHDGRRRHRPAAPACRR